MRLLTAIFGVSLGLMGCSSGGSSSSSTQTSVVLSANLTSATSVARVQPIYSSASSSAVGVTTNAATSGLSGNDLVGIDASGNLARVFQSSIPIYTTMSTTNYLIVMGQFQSTSSTKLMNSKGAEMNCPLIASPKHATGSPSEIVCLTDGLNLTAIGGYMPGLAPSNSFYSHYGFATRGNNVYFTDLARGILYKWTEGQTQALPIFTYSPGYQGSGLIDVFLDPASNNICVLYPGLSNGSTDGSGNPVFYEGDLFCGNDSGLTNTVHGGLYTQVGNTSNFSGPVVLSGTFLMNQYVVLGNSKIDITNISAGVVSRTAGGNNGGLPLGSADIVSDGNGGVVARAYAYSLGHVSANGDTAVIADTTSFSNQYFQQVIKVGSYIWTWSVPASTGCGQTSCGIWDYALNFLGNYTAITGGEPKIGQTLRRIAVSTTPVIDTVGDGSNSGNYLSNVQMDYVKNMNLKSDGTLNISGMQNGSAKSASIDGAGAITINTGSSVPLDHIINL